MKTCTKCNVEQPKAEFYKQKGGKDGLRSTCKACVRAYQAENVETISARQLAHYADNAETIKEKRRARYAENTESELAQQRIYYSENTELVRARQRAYQAANPTKKAARHRNRRAMKRNAEGSHTAADIQAIFESQRGKCANCPKKLIKSGKNRYHVDHIQPLARGGSNDKYNLQCLCPDCNQRKHAKDPIDWAKDNGRLL